MITGEDLAHLRKGRWEPMAADKPGDVNSGELIFSLLLEDEGCSQACGGRCGWGHGWEGFRQRG